MKKNRPKLYGMIRQHLSAESKDEIKGETDYEEWHKRKDPEKLWQAIEKTHKVDSISTVTEVIQLTACKAYQGMNQGPYETLVSFSERFHNTYKSNEDNGNEKVLPNVQAMDFFHVLEGNKYGNFKASMLNSWAAKACKPLLTVNEIYRLAGAWVKTMTGKNESGTASTFMTNIENAKKKGNGNKKTQKDL